MKNKYRIAIAVLFCFGLSTAFAQVQLKSGNSLTSSIATTAIFEVQSSSKGILPPRMSTVQRDAIVSPVAGLSIYNIDTGYLEFWDSSNWILVCDDSFVPVIASAVTNKLWMDRNLGASRQALSSTDHLAYGGLYQWGRKSDGHQVIDWTSSSTGTVNGVAAENANNTTSTKSDTPADAKFITSSGDWRVNSNDALWAGYSGVNNPCPCGFRVPTRKEWEDETNITDRATAWDELKLVLAGYRSKSVADLRDTGSNGFYWSATVDGTSAYYRVFHSSGAGSGSVARAFGMSVRCLKE
ncbi:MAG: FISUMP domain-containing protein [Nonlabens sp.]|uniref:hypothetical protein n=1 Tax=Nonlabens sp. TaxID=1888209 RepID=UPI0035A5C912